MNLPSLFLIPLTDFYNSVSVAISHVQHLFMQHPRSVFLIGSLALLLLLLLAFTAYHVYLIAINQTTNERFKLSSLQASSNNNNADDSIPTTQHIGNFYNKGLLMNLYEIFFPQLPKGKQAPAKEISPVSANGHPVQPRREAPRHRSRRK